jgi:hypothetical protein
MLQHGGGKGLADDDCLEWTVAGQAELVPVAWAEVDA